MLVCFCLGEPPTRVLLFTLLRRVNSPLLRLLKHKGISPVATGAKGSSPLTSPPFEKGGRKLLNILLCKQFTNFRTLSKKYSTHIFSQGRTVIF